MSFQVQILPSERSFAVEDHETVLEAAQRQGLTLPYTCRKGLCGNCRGRLMSGEYHYPEKYRAESKLAPGEILLCQARPRSDLRVEVEEIEAPREIGTLRLPCKVARRELLSHDVMRLYLKLPDARRLQFFAGQYLDVITGDEERRSFSIANAPHEDEFVELHIRHVDGGEFTDYIFNELRENALWRVEAPLGTFFLREKSVRPIIMMGGGTGLAPLKGMVEHARYVGIQRPIHLFWGVRAQQDLYLDTPETWARDMEHFQYTPVLSEPDPGEKWAGETGWVHESVLRHYPDLSGFDLYMSGPPPMIDAAQEAFVGAGLRPERTFSDAFEYNRQTGENSSSSDAA